ncbi:amidohydrolase family protein [Polaromonas sp.]|uniref:N-acyl-D-amino-acid deacylase family protein n=1 Tax=Polaromonas sp. TaxID=1869339 RepID=UPI002730D109|nr:amidohydrolase family protein [Polaromonas sp.]MDP1740741.1 amidohydrolase family protein [Polaromonas sp.]
MLDLLLKGGTVVDGSGGEPFVADVGVRDGRIVVVGTTNEAALETVDAHGLWLTPGFVDIHTHYDGQVTWDDNFTPSIYHGVTTLVMGNCGVGFAPVRSGHQDDLIKLMEGVEDIPGAALHEGIRWDWESFPQYMDALEKTPRSLDYLVQVPHDPLRMYVMGERAVAKQMATPDDIAAMRALLHAALQAGAAGFSTGRSDNHRTSEGKETPAAEATAAELVGLAGAFDGIDHGVLQVVSDFNLLQGPEGFDAEFDLVEQLARASGKPLSMTWLQRDPGGAQYEAIRERVDAAVAAGLPLYLQAAARGIGVINGLDASFHPFMGFPGYKEVAHLPLAERAAALREPARKARILAEKSDRLAGDGTAIPPLVDILLARIDMISGRMFPLDATLNYEPNVMQSFLVLAKQRGITPLEALYDHLAGGDGSHLIYFPIFNYNSGSLDAVRQMLDHPRVLSSLSDAGAHVGTVCDASFTTFMLTHWVLGRAQGKLPLARAVEMMTQRNARYLGLTDRGTIAPGQRADLNLIDPQRLSVGTPVLVRDLPAGGKRFLQKAQGYVGTWVAGVAVQREGEITAGRPGRLVRMGQALR